MLIAFELSMPSNNAWNGRWTGEGRVYARVLNVGGSKKARAKWEGLAKQRHFRHAFGDGWVACVTVSEVDAKAARDLRKRSMGFCGYDWMIDNIRFHGTASDPPTGGEG